MFSVEYINIPKFIAIMVIAYLMNDVFLFMKFGNYARVYNCCSEFWISQK